MAEQIVPPGEAIVAKQMPPDAPGNHAGRFSIVDIIPGSENISEIPGVVMYTHGKGVTAPVDEETGIPLPIWFKAPGTRQDYDHAYFYRENYVTGTPAQQALRLSRLQRVNRVMHDSKHSAYRGIKPPEDEDDIYRQIVLNLAGYVPRHAVRILNNKHPDIFELSDKKRRKLRQPGRFKAEGQAKINNFLVDYAYDRGFTESEHSLIEQFLSITPKQRKDDPALRESHWKIGMKLTGRAIGFANDPFTEEFAKLRRSDALRVGAPVCAWLVVRKFLKGKEIAALGSLESRLSAEYS